MLEVLNFIFRDGWAFLGTVVLIAVTGEALQGFRKRG